MTALKCPLSDRSARHHVHVMSVVSVVRSIGGVGVRIDLRIAAHVRVVPASATGGGEHRSLAAAAVGDDVVNVAAATHPSMVLTCVFALICMSDGPKSIAPVSRPDTVITAECITCSMKGRATTRLIRNSEICMKS